MGDIVLFHFASMGRRQLLPFQPGGVCSFFFLHGHMKLMAVLFLSFVLFSPVGLSGPINGGSHLAHGMHGANRPTRVAALLASQLTMIILTLAIVILRLIARFFVDKNPGWDDHAIIAATVNKMTDSWFKRQT